MNIKNLVLAEVKMKWDQEHFPILAGTPVSRSGLRHDDAEAYGIILGTINEPPLFERVYVAVGGDVEDSEYGIPTTEARNAMSGLRYAETDSYTGPDVFRAFITKLTQSGQSFSVDKSVDELSAAYNAGDHVFVNYNDVLTSLTPSRDQSGEIVGFSGRMVNDMNGTPIYAILNIGPNGVTNTVKVLATV